MGNSVRETAVARPLSSAAPRVELGGAALADRSVPRSHLRALGHARADLLGCWSLTATSAMAITEDVGDDETPASVGVVPVLRLAT